MSARILETHRSGVGWRGCGCQKPGRDHAAVSYSGAGCRSSVRRCRWPPHATASERWWTPSGRATDERLVLYVLERFLYRVSVSEHRDRLVLKGGMLLAALDQRRPTPGRGPSRAGAGQRHRRRHRDGHPDPADRRRRGRVSHHGADRRHDPRPGCLLGRARRRSGHPGDRSRRAQDRRQRGRPRHSRTDRDQLSHAAGGSVHPGGLPDRDGPGREAGHRGGACCHHHARPGLR